MMEERVNVKFRAKLQKSPAGQKPVHGINLEEFPQAKEDTDVKVQDQNNVDLLFRHQEYHPLRIFTQGPVLIRHSMWR
jgi:hypothetical protein